MGDILSSKPKKDREAERLMAEQEKKEKLRLAEEKSGLATTKSKLQGLKGKALIKTSATGIQSNIAKTTGGTY